MTQRAHLCSLTRRRLLASAAATCAGCASRVGPPAAPVAEWRAVPLPGKRETVYTRCEYEGRPAWHASSQAAASLWRKRIDAVVTPSTQVEFSWWVAGTIAGADLSRAEVADSPVRVGFAFDGDASRLSMRNRMQFQLIETLTGEGPPFATLMYVWDNHAPLEAVLPSPRTDRIRKIDYGAFLLQLPSLAVAIYTNGDFLIDIGFPHGGDFSNSLIIDAGQFTGAGGVYYGRLSGETAMGLPPVPTDASGAALGVFNPVTAIGIGLVLIGIPVYWFWKRREST